MKRRELLLSAMSATALPSLAEAAPESEPAHHHGGGDVALIDSAFSCIKAGELCQAHCFDLFAEGDSSVAACARSVDAMRAVCSALTVLAAQRSPLLPRYATVAKDVCKNCEDECRKHADKHAPCKACGEACAACARECARVAA